MEKWSHYLLRFLLWSGMLAIASVLLLYLFLGWYANSGCGYSSRTIAPEKGAVDAVVSEKCCDWGCVVTVTLRNKGLWDSTEAPVFVYNPSDSVEPVVKWLNPNELEIALDQTPHIVRQVTGMWGVKIIYRVGKDYP